MKKSLAPLIALVSILALSSTVFAQDTTDATTSPTATSSPISGRNAVLTQAAERRQAVLTQAASRREAVISKAAEKKAEVQENVMENLRKRATREIDRRTKSLEKLVTRISNIKKLSDLQKTSLSTQVQTEITNLATLKTKIEADTDIETLRTDVKSIVASYRIYALFIPKIHTITAAEALTELADKLDTTYTALKTRVDQAKAEGTDTTEMEKSLTQMQTNIADAKVQATNAINTVTPLTPSGYPANLSSLKAARENLRTARMDLAKARTEGKNVLRALRNKRSMISPSASPTEPTASTSSN